MSKTAVVILNWDNAAQTRCCFDIARRMTGVDAHWIIVDNGFLDPIGEIEGATLIRNPTNLGFTGGVNCGLRHAFEHGANTVWLLNNDAEPVHGALDELLATVADDPAIGLASAVLLNVDDNDAIGFHGGRWDDLGYHTTANPEEYARWLADDPKRIWLAGTALLVTRRLVEQIGYFDESFFAYWEDNDISRRSAAAGFRNVVVPKALVRHRSGHPATNPAERPPYYYYYMTRNELKLLQKTGELTKARLTYWTFRRIARLRKRLSMHPAQRRAVRQGVMDWLLGRQGAYRG